MRRAKATGFPALEVTDVRPERLDEWVGIRVDFRWTTPLDIERYRSAVRGEADAWFKSNLNAMHVGLFPLEERMADHIRASIVSSPAWANFFTPERAARLGRFGERDISDWDFDARGGTASASRR